MRGDCENRDLLSAGSVEPENPPRRRSPVLCVGFEDFFAAGSPEGVEFVGLESGVAGVRLQQAQCFSHCLESFRKRSVGLQVVEIRRGPISEFQCEAHGSVDFIVGESSETAARACSPLGGIPQTIPHGVHGLFVLE